MSEIATLVNIAGRNKLLFLPHAVRQMFEDYPEDARGHSCLILGAGEAGRKIHVVCAPRPEYLAIITAYLPETGEWDQEFRIRRPS